MRWITLGTSLSIAGVAAWYSIAGLMAIFSGAAVPIAIMGGVLEVGKLVTASWLHNNWKGVEWWLRTYLVTAVVVLMLITSLGIFGFLSKAHLEHSVSVGGNNVLQIENLERQIGNEQRTIKDAETVLAQLDATVQTLIDYDRIRGPEGALATRKAQTEEREALNTQINDAFSSIEQLQEELAPLKQEQLSIEVEVGPLKYIAELIYGDAAKDMFDEAVRIVILLLIFVFDPLAVALLLVASRDFKDNKKSKMFYEDGNLRVDPNNVVAVDVEIEQPEPVVEPIIEEVLEEVVIPDDEDESDYEVVVEEPEDEGHGIVLEEPSDPTDPVRKHEPGWYTQFHGR